MFPVFFILFIIITPPIYLYFSIFPPMMGEKWKKVFLKLFIFSTLKPLFLFFIPPSRLYQGNPSKIYTPVIFLYNLGFFYSNLP